MSLVFGTDWGTDTASVDSGISVGSSFFVRSADRSHVPASRLSSDQRIAATSVRLCPVSMSSLTMEPNE